MSRSYCVYIMSRMPPVLRVRSTNEQATAALRQFMLNKVKRPFRRL
jgi:hypothetical protein